MADEQNEQAWVAGQVADVRRIAEVGFTDVRGQLALIRQGQEQNERRHAELAATVAENHRAVSERLDDHAKAIQTAAEERAAERSRVQTMADNAKKFSTWVPIVVSLVFGVLGIVLKGGF
ncbi:hypothetical protein [Nonomuraea candida]|uniref:hypothetical protein n=1 Tax=Nonomuraea candida TaxID=359159 RepID=UPI0005B8A6A9|nr:hypothetical protein [Nonomuraea candida]